jgi:hypothetical protein
MQDPCKCIAEMDCVTYCWHYVYVTVPVQSHWINKQQRESGEVVLAKPF